MNDLHGEKIVSDALEDVSNENVECFDGRMFIGEEARWNLRSPQADWLREDSPEKKKDRVLQGYLLRVACSTSSTFQETSERVKQEKSQKAAEEAAKREEQKRAEEKKRLEQENINIEKKRREADKREVVSVVFFCI